MCAIEEELITKNDDCDEHVSQDHDEDSEYFHQLCGDFHASEKEELE